MACFLNGASLVTRQRRMNAPSPLAKPRTLFNNFEPHAPSKTIPRKKITQLKSCVIKRAG